MAAIELYNTSLLADANIQGYYRFESGALTTDSSGKGITLNNNGTVGETTGKFGGGADFGISNAGKNFTSTNSYSITNQNAWSVSFWAKLAQAQVDEEQDVFFSLVVNGYGSFFLRLYKPTGGATQIDLVRNNGLTQESDTLASSPGTTDWHHYVVTVTTTTMRFYYDSADQGATTCSGTANGTTTQLTVGNNFDGYIDDVVIYNDVLSGAEISGLYNGTLDKYYHQAASDSFTLSEASIRSFGKVLSDVYIVSESAIKSVAKTLSDIFTLSTINSTFHSIWEKINPTTSSWSGNTPTTATWSESSPGATTWTENVTGNDG
jgi:hypothetical protein